MGGQNLLKMLWPADATDRRMFACVSIVRLLLVPGTTLLLVRGLVALRLLPDDPVCTLSVLVQVKFLWPDCLSHTEPIQSTQFSPPPYPLTCR